MGRSFRSMKVVFKIDGWASFLAEPGGLAELVATLGNPFVAMRFFDRVAPFGGRRFRKVAASACRVKHPKAGKLRSRIEVLLHGGGCLDAFPPRRTIMGNRLDRFAPLGKIFARRASFSCVESSHSKGAAPTKNPPQGNLRMKLTTIVLAAAFAVAPALITLSPTPPSTINRPSIASTGARATTAAGASTVADASTAASAALTVADASTAATAAPQNRSRPPGPSRGWTKR